MKSHRPLLAAAIASLGLALGAAGMAPAALAMGSDSTPTETQVDEYKSAVALIKKEQYAKAIPLLEASLKKKGDYADALNQLGFANRKLGNWKLGMEYYLKALALEPDHLGANEYLGQLYLEQKDLANAEAQLAKLQAACGDCDEFEELEESIADYKEENAIN
ncbi:MAG: tetratricopeptide repeat protein [Rhodospirillaceae bacterium]|nr:tetratricopeptide repeat protein [Rhodospirillaceae bacterium]